MLDSVRGKIAAGLGMMACCGLSMAIALGLIAFTSTLVISGVVLAVVAGCVAFMIMVGPRRGHSHKHDNRDDHDSTEPAAEISG